MIDTWEIFAFTGVFRGFRLADGLTVLALIRKYAFLAGARNGCQGSSKMGFSSGLARIFTAPIGAVRT